MTRAGPNRGTILVTDAGRGSAVAIIRSLSRQQWRVVAADCDRRSAGLRSRFVSERLVYRDPAQDPAAFVAAMREAVADRQVDLVIPVTDETLLPLSAARAQFDGLCRLAVPDTAALNVTTNKQQTLELAQSLGVPVPRTVVVTTRAEAQQAVGHFTWPIVLKPASSRLCGSLAWQCNPLAPRVDASTRGASRLHCPSQIERLEVAYARDANELARRMAIFEGRCAVLLQEYVAGTGHGVEVLASRGRCLAAFQHRRLREVPITGGASSLRESVTLDPVLFDYAERLIRALDWTGLAMVEFKTGPAGPRLMEINGRVWGSLPLAVASGMDFPARLAELHLGETHETHSAPDTNYRTRVRSRNLELEMLWIGSVLFGRRRYPFLPAPSRWRALMAAVGLFNPTCRFDILSLRDPAPGLAEIGRIGRKLWSKLT